MAHKITIWNPKTELEELEDKVAKLKEDEEVCQAKLLVPTAAIKEAGWDKDLIQEAIERGRARARGEEIGEASWEDLERESGGPSDDEVSEASEIPGLETPEEEPSKPGRVFNLLGDMGGEEPEQEEEVHEEESEESPYLEREGETREEYNKRMFDEFFGDIKKEEAMETEVTKENLTDKMAAHLADTRRKVIVGDETGWLCENCNRVWSLKQPFCPNKDCPNERPRPLTGLEANVRFPEAVKTGTPVGADSDWLRQHMEKHLDPVVEKKGIMADRMKEALGIERLPGEPEPCGVCGAQDAEMCGCCFTCEETDGRCKCCEHCHDHPCVCDTTEECPICEARIPIGDACPTGCDADTIELMKLYEEVKNSKDLDFVEKARYMALLKDKMNFAQNEEIEENMEPDYGPYDEAEEDDYQEE